MAGDPETRPFGEALRGARMRQRLSIDDVAAATKIRQPTITAIENEDLTRMPSSVFATGLIQTYARFLGLPVEPLLDDYRERLGIDRSEIGAPAPASAAVHFQTRRPRRSRSPWVALVAVVALVVLARFAYGEVQSALPASTTLANIAGTATPIALAAIVGTPAAGVVGTDISGVPTPSVNPIPSATNRSAPTATAIAPTETPPPTATQPRPTDTVLPTAVPTAVLATSSSGLIRADAQIIGRVWLQVETDNTVAFSGILNAGDQKSWSATRTLKLWVGNAANVVLARDGGSPAPMGKAGQIVQITLTPVAG